MRLKYCSNYWNRKGNFLVETLKYSVNAIVHCSMSVIDVGAFVFFDTLVTQLSSDNTRGI